MVGGPRWARVLLAALAVGCAAALAVVLAVAATLDRNEPGTAAGAGAAAPAARALAAVALVALLAHAGGLLARACRQPSVVGQIAAGLLAGPSVLGAVVPQASSVLYGADVLPELRTVAELGVIFFVLQIGHELAARRAPAGTRALLPAAVGLLIPFTLGAAVALGAHRSLAPPGVGLPAFVSFLGLALCATALPVLARILAEQRMAESPVGVLALRAAAYTDALVWVGVAALSASRGDPGAAELVGLALVAAGAAAVLPVRRAIGRQADRWAGVGPGPVLAVLVVAVLLVGTASGAVLGHPGVGALACGLALPAGIAPLDTALRHLRTVTEALFLPVFFAVAGLSIRLDAVGGGGLALLALVLAAAFAGKLGGCALAVRAQGLPWRPALRFGVLMNCRGATELVLVNIGVSLGMVGARLYAVLVLLALVSTALTGPLLRLLPIGSEEAETTGPTAATSPGPGRAGSRCR